MRRCLSRLLFVILLPLASFASDTTPPVRAAPATSPIAPLRSWLEEHNALLSWKAGLGYDDNVYLLPSNGDSDIFLDLQAELEGRREFDNISGLDYAAAIELRKHVSEGDADEMWLSLEGGYDRVINDTIDVGVHDRISYEDYTTFEEQGGVIPSGNYSSWGNRIRGWGAWQIAGGHDLSAGLSHEIRAYDDDELDYSEVTFDIAYDWTFDEKTSLGLSMELSAESYDKLLSAEPDGTILETAPTVDIDGTTIGANVTRKIGKYNRLFAWVELDDSKDKYKGEASYSEPAIGTGGQFQIGRDYAILFDLALSWRDYDKRLTDNALDTQSDEFTYIELELRRRIVKGVNAFLILQRDSRTSNDPNDEYESNSLCIGVKGVL